MSCDPTVEAIPVEVESPPASVFVERRGNSHWKAVAPRAVAVAVQAIYGSQVQRPVAYYERWGNNGRMIET